MIRNLPYRCSMTVAYGVAGAEYAHGAPGVVSSIPSVRQCGRPTTGAAGFCAECETEFATDYPQGRLMPAWAASERTVVAVIRDRETGAVMDWAWNWHTAHSSVLDGRLATAVADDEGYMSMAEQQDLYDDAADAYYDCFLLTLPTTD